MAYRARNQRMTIYDIMEARGVFAANPANADSMSEDGTPLYRGPVEYPRMFYHPTGETRMTNPGETIVTPLGPKTVGVQSEIVWQIAQDEAEAQVLRVAGWHDHPAKAIAAGGGEAPPISPAQRIADSESEIERLKAQIAQLEAERNDESSKLVSTRRSRSEVHE